MPPWRPAWRPWSPELTVDHREQLLLVYLDGEVTHLRSPLRYRNRARDLRVIVPPARSERGSR